MNVVGDTMKASERVICETRPLWSETRDVGWVQAGRNPTDGATDLKSTHIRDRTKLELRWTTLRLLVSFLKTRGYLSNCEISANALEEAFSLLIQ